MSANGDFEPPFASVEPPLRAEPARPTRAERILALLEVVICSDYPTQLALGTTIAALGFGPISGQGLNLTYVVVVSLADTVLLLTLIAMFLSVHGERPRDLFLGSRAVAAEARAGIPLALVALVVGVGILLAIQLLAPALHDVPDNPLKDLIRTPRDILMFGVVVVVAGGVREEIQRAFLLHRFERWLGGGTVGLVVTSLSFGAGHIIQGIDAAIATGVLGAFWGIVYLRRRSTIAPMVSHSGFNLLQLAQFLTLGK
jgi:membrane protease YdiL (CAAX protease family)